MKRKFFAAFLSLCMVISLVPMTALAAEDTGTTSAPTASGNNFFANGTPITISATAPEDGTPVTFDAEFTATGSSAYISWDDDGTTKCVGVSDAVSVWGGADGSSSTVSVGNASITMTGGTVKNILGGNLGQENADQNGCSSVTGDVNISITGGSVTELIYGGGENNTCVDGTVAITLENVKLGTNCYVNGGVLGHGKEGVRNIENGTMTTYAVVNKVIINATDSTAYVLGGGGSGSTKVKEAIVTLNGCTVANLYASGINGEMEKSSLKATDCTVTGELAATNRGFIKTADVTLKDCKISLLMTGATTGCFETDSGKPDGSGITGSIVWKIDEQTEVTTARLTPLAKRDKNDQTTATLDNITIEKSGDPLEISVDEFKPRSSASVKTFLVSETGTLTLNNVETTIAKDNTLTNAGTINMDETSSLTVASGATLQQAGTVNGDVVVDEGGTITKYVARVGNNGYETLVDALTAAGENATITLLKDATLEADITISKNITIDGQDKYKIDAQPAKDHAITVDPNGALTLENVALNITNGSVETGSYGLDVQYGATLTLDNADVTLAGLSNATISSKPNSAGTEPGKFVLTKGSTITANNIGGNFSNGGTWSLSDGSKIDINTCTSHGLSCDSLTVNGSSVEVSGTGLLGVTAKDINLTNNAKITVDNCGSKLAEETNKTWATDGESYKYPVEIKKGGKVTIDSTSSMVLQNNANNNTIYFVESTLDNNGTLQANVVTKAPDNSFSVTVKDGSTVLDVANVTSGATYTLPAALPDQGYNHFVGWRDQDGKNYEGGAKVENISKDMTFTAQWAYIPPANPNYKITIGDTANGTITANPTAAKAGATVTLTATPDEGYAVGSITVTDRFGDAVKVTEQANGTYTFVMPDGQVTVTATFVETEAPVDEPFVDVAEGDWFYDAVVYAYQNELMDGVGGNRFAPNSETTRAQLVTILYRLEGEPAVSGDLPFTDVETGTWYTNAVLWAAQNGIVNGVTDTTFAPGDEITRQQLVTILYRYAEAKGYDVSASADLSGYPDADQVQDYAQPAMAWAVAENIIQGMEDGTLKPAGNASRAQIATILMRFCEDVAQ